MPFIIIINIKNKDNKCIKHSVSAVPHAFLRRLITVDIKIPRERFQSKLPLVLSRSSRGTLMSWGDGSQVPLFNNATQKPTETADGLIHFHRGWEKVTRSVDIVPT